MGLFGGDKKKKLQEAAKKAREEKKKRLEAIIKAADVSLPSPSKKVLRTPDYETFLKEIRRKPRGGYEKFCKFSEHIPGISLGKKFNESLQEDINASYLNVTPKGVTGLATLAFLLGLLLGLFFLVVMLDLFFMLFMSFLGLGVAYYVLNTPAYRARSLVLKMSGDSVLAILYMIIYMRASPNLEGAIRFASENLEGPLALDLKKLMWDMEVGVYPNADAAMAAYIHKWKRLNPEFAESLNLLRGTSVRKERKKELFDEILNVILDGTAERTKRYVTGLRLPVMIIHAMGVLLPVMGLVMFPIILIFMSDSVKPIFLFMGYDVILPVVLWFFMFHIIQSKPPTFSQPDLGRMKDLPPMGKVRVGKRDFPIWIFSSLLFILIIGVGILWGYSCFAVSGLACEKELLNLSVTLIVAIAFSISLYAYLDSYQKVKIRDEIELIEEQFSVALFQLGNHVSSGLPIERALDKSVGNLEGMKIADLFKFTVNNMKKFGMTFRKAVFDEKLGSVWIYPSGLIKSIMNIIVESSRKGMAATSNAMITISRYLKGVHNVREEVEDVLGETVVSMKFLATFLAPVISGLTITMAIIILQILAQLGSQISSLIVDDGGAGMSSLQYTAFFGVSLNGGVLPIGTAEFQLIVGLYMLETVILLSMFVNSIKYGDDAIGLRSTLATTLFLATVVYILSWTFTGMLFGDPITKLLTPTV